MEDRPDLGPDGKQYLVYPGGKVDEGERADHAMEREFNEETGCRAGLWHVLGEPIPAGNGWQTIPFVMLSYVGDIPLLAMGERNAQFVWVDPVEIAMLGLDDGYTARLQVAHRLVNFRKGVKQPTSVASDLGDPTGYVR